MTLPRNRIIASLVIALVTSMCGCAQHRGGDSEGAGSSAEDAVVDVHVAVVVSRSFESAVAAPGQWRSSGELVVASAFPGVLESLKARVGDHISRSQTLGYLITRDSWEALHGAELMRAQAHDAASRTEAQAAVALARRDLVRVPLLAPRSGVVIRRSVEPGAQVAESAEILAVVPIENVVFEAHVPAASGPRLRVGERATVTDQDGVMRGAAVVRVLPMAGDADQSVLAWLSPDSHTSTPALDRYGSARIVVGSPHLAPAIPDSAVVEDDLTGKRQIAIVGAGQRIEWTGVELGLADGNSHEVLRPAFRAGTTVVTSGQRGLPDRTRVKWER